MTYQEIIQEAIQSEEIVMLKIDGDWYSARWVSNAEDGSPYGTTAFADENNMAMAHEDAEDARWPEKGEGEYIPSNEERREDAIQHVRDREEGKRQDALRIKRERTKYRRIVLESEYLRVTGNDDGSQLTMAQMRERIATKRNSEFHEKLTQVMKGFGL